MLRRSWGTTVIFAKEIVPMIQSRCINCHGGDRIEESLSMNTHAEIITGPENGAILVPVPCKLSDLEGFF